MKKVNSAKKKVLIIISIIVVISIAFFIISLINKNNINKMYKKYNEKMDTYDFSKLYENGISNSNDSVSKLEAIKIILASNYNVTDVKRLLMDAGDLSEDEMWLECAYRKNLITKEDINMSNCKERIRYIDIISYLDKSFKLIQGKDITQDLEIKISDYTKYTTEKQNSIKNLVNIGALDNVQEKLNGNKYAIKGKFNKLIVKYVETLNIIIPGSLDSIRTDLSTYPSNSSEYPYIIEGVENEVYEQPFTFVDKNESVNPAEYYKQKKDYYRKVQDRCENYFDILLNIDYNTINKDEIYNSTSQHLVNPIDNYSLERYIEYVKSNKIIISGKSTVQMPIVYSDGYYCRVRIKLEFEVKNSDTKYDLLLFDVTSGKKIKYNENKYVLYIDADMAYFVNSNDPHLRKSLIYENLLPISKDKLIAENEE